jgi:preprotein translocase subunit SecD
VVISNSDIRAVAVERSRIGYRISILFTDQAAARLRAVTERNLQKRIAILIDGSILIAPVIQEPIGEQAAIEHGYSKEEAIALTRKIAP